MCFSLRTGIKLRLIAGEGLVSDSKTGASGVLGVLRDNDAEPNTSAARHRAAWNCA